jgi:hypothetical protein
MMAYLNDSKDTKLINKAFTTINHGLMAQIRHELPFTTFKRARNEMRFLHQFFAD